MSKSIAKIGKTNELWKHLLELCPLGYVVKNSSKLLCAKHFDIVIVCFPFQKFSILKFNQCLFSTIVTVKSMCLSYREM
jgi:hypothetical protein